MKILITGVAGFIGYHLAQRLLLDGEQIYGIDNLNDYYDVNLKKARLAQLTPNTNFQFKLLDLNNREGILQLFQEENFDCVVNLAAQAGVRYSLENPFAYVDSNLVGFANLIEACRHTQPQHLVFASSSSVYGTNTKIPFSVTDNVDNPVSLYAATKKANELMAHSYSHLYSLPITGLRFFTVYGAWGRPDMAYFKFVKAIAENQPINIFNYGKMQRDFTYIDDVIEGVVRVMHQPPKPQLTNENNNARYKIYNIGNNQPVELLAFIEVIEKAMGKEAIKNFLPMQPGDVPRTYADVDELMRDVGFKPTTNIEEGIENFVRWYKDFYQCETQTVFQITE
ncbi:NAD-dependent epimerase [Plectonema cf. radiosum LEGE 06105]|uniref:NAD-dependent epimerase n=1 Tax=Plectonema cf. radiosum LEGE 06105 TaxID=945769 RepID=A0A8J7FBZ7_9CYAN|nr:NAD-dependent epimerase [Plectonema radiosum]MBE9215584.1 NAD-dependent epimerase [Plectonema cf. radiosum LEGE 06105]